MTEALTIVERLIQLGLTGFLIFVLYGGYRGWWVFGPYHNKIVAGLQSDVVKAEKRETEWKDLFFESKNITRRAITMAAQQSPLQDGG